MPRHAGDATAHAFNLCLYCLEFINVSQGCISIVFGVLPYFSDIKVTILYYYVYCIILLYYN